MFEVGRLAVKTAGRDAGKKCVVIDTVDDNHVLIDGETRRKKCNLKHLEPLHNVIKISKGISHEDLAKELKKLNIEARSTKPKQAAEKPKKQKKEKPKPEDKKSKKADKPKEATPIKEEPKK